ncbi:betaine/proline/choline family ABC transporter ATP-binding protein [Alkalicoccobacillus porphyridii]|uniref:Quaternary amine transport ATP-binding protein n=1 Tax=Alkalicoccobacillus porphyridii TaxID=2597270 RepID=A0A553ZYR7_9BACI|nr:betaine/proline/choline family ABC transporter ATP-binding protein [Alkalicoccobacillus porphyridii]TSB46582.1 betaine/proline/choline family ABC transporter ATP-binding protein [Alkalicoccobacillus porphyridii]
MLRMENVTKTYKGGKKAVDEFSLHIKKGEFICIIGPSGCGKTTTMKMINRLIEPSSGEIFVNDENLLKQDAVKLRRKIGYVIQQIGLFPHMTIGDNISLVPRLLKWESNKKAKRAEELLELVDMPKEFLDRYPHELSGGQQQRIGVLRALAANPPLILMDEPFGALDPITRDALQEEFKRLQRSLDKTIVFVTHDMDEAIKLADRIVIMKDGKIVQVDSPEEILRNPANQFVEDFIGKERLLQGRPNVQTIGQVMNKKPISVNRDQSVAAALRIMKENRVDSLLVTDDSNRLKGYIDLEVIDHNRGLDSIETIIKPALNKVEETSLLRDTIQRLLKRGVSYAPVVNDQGILVGIVTRANLVDMVYDSIWGDEEESSPEQVEV